MAVGSQLVSAVAALGSQLAESLAKNARLEQDNSQLRAELEQQQQQRPFAPRFVEYLVEVPSDYSDEQGKGGAKAAEDHRDKGKGDKGKAESRWRDKGKDKRPERTAAVDSGGQGIVGEDVGAKGRFDPPRHPDGRAERRWRSSSLAEERRGCGPERSPAS